LECVEIGAGALIFSSLVLIWVWLAYQFLNEFVFPGYHIVRVVFLMLAVANLYWMNWTSRAIIALLILLVLSYNKIEGWQKLPLNWRSLPLLKNALIACCWIVLPLAVLPLAIPENKETWLAWLLHQWMVIFVLSMLEDYCHAAHDSTPTFSNRLKPGTVSILLSALSILSMIPCLIALTNAFAILSIGFVLVIMAILPHVIRRLNTTWTQSLLIDGMIILHAAAVVLSSYT
jgi:hypothetical protein